MVGGADSVAVGGRPGCQDLERGAVTGGGTGRIPGLHGAHEVPTGAVGLVRGGGAR